MGRATVYEVIDGFLRYHRDFHKQSAKRPSLAQSGAAKINPSDWRELNCRTGTLARAIYEEETWAPATPSLPLLFLLNGDDLGPATFGNGPAAQQFLVRNEVQRSGVPHAIISFEAMRAAGIDLDTVRLLDVKADEWIHQKHESPNFSDVPSWAAYHEQYNGESMRWEKKAKEPYADGLYRWTTSDHFLGAALFTADYTNPEDGSTHSAFFLSAFDQDEPLRRRNYFLAQLPTEAYTYEEALETLKPVEVLKADAMDLEYTRQGDIFAIPVVLSTQYLKSIPGMVYGSRSGAPYPYWDSEVFARTGSYVVDKRSYEARQNCKLLGTDHEATYVITLPDGTTYAKGCLYHNPRFRRPDHIRKKMGDGKAWHLIIQNNVARSHSGTMRAWSIVGRID